MKKRLPEALHCIISFSFPGNSITPWKNFWREGFRILKKRPSFAHFSHAAQEEQLAVTTLISSKLSHILETFRQNQEHLTSLRSLASPIKEQHMALSTANAYLDRQEEPLTSKKPAEFSPL